MPGSALASVSLAILSLLMVACGGGGGSAGAGGNDPPQPSPPRVTNVTLQRALLFGQVSEFLVEGTNLDSSDFRYDFSGACTPQAAGAQTPSRYVIRCLPDEVGMISLALTNATTQTRLGSSPYTWEVKTPQVKLVIGNALQAETVIVTLNAGSRGNADNDWALHFLYYVNRDFYPKTSLHFASSSLVEAGCYEYQNRPLQTATRSDVPARSLPDRSPSSNSKNLAGTFSIGPRACDSSSARNGTLFAGFAFNIVDNSDGKPIDRDNKGWKAIGTFFDDAASIAAVGRLGGLNIPRAANNFCPFASEPCYWPDWSAPTAPPTELRQVEQIR